MFGIYNSIDLDQRLISCDVIKISGNPPNLMRFLGIPARFGTGGDGGDTFTPGGEDGN